jgi:serine/threonine protein kinase/formylglycine-generating enzyme required for sulfatase activity
MSERKSGSEADETILRQDSSKTSSEQSGQSSDASAETIIRGSETNSAAETAADVEVASDAETIVRGQDPAGDSGGTDPVDSPASDDATIIRGAEAPATPDAATIVRSPDAQNAVSDSATILREPGSATILRSGDEMRNAPPEAATILRDGTPDAATILRQETPPDDDATVINIPDDDATVINAGGSGDTTQFASPPGGQKASKSNSEAGRLLKNRFVLEEKVGSGGMGDVYKALDLRQQEAQERNPYIAIKILNESFARHKDAFISLQRETTRTRGIPHPNIMAVYDFDKEGDTVFMSMELLDGKPLDDYLKEHPEGVSTEDAWNIIDGICQGLGRAHGAGIVHSDFKPGNIYYTKDKTCKVFDFGIARAVSNPNELEADGEKTVFDAGSLGALTPTYASYEMLKGLEPTKSDDVYAVALVAYELFTGKHPYNRVPADKALERGIEPEAPANLKRRHWRALRKALEIKGENRTQTIDEFYEGMFSEDPPYLRYSAIAAVLVLSIGFGVYQQFFRAAEELPEEFTEYMTSYTSANGNINSRLSSPDFDSDGWHSGIELALNRMSFANIKMQDEYAEYLDEGWEEVAKNEIQDKRLEVMSVYLDKIESLRSTADGLVVDTNNREQVEAAVAALAKATELMGIVKEKYNFNAEQVSAEEVQLVSRVDLRDFQLETIAKNEIAAIEAEEARIAAEEARLAAIEAERVRNENYDTELNNFRDILRCKGDIENQNIYGENGLEGIIARLARIYPARFEVDKPGIVAALAGCIEQRVAVRAPERARTIKAAVTDYLPGEARLASIEIVDLDPCAKRGLAGQGSRNRQWCEDQLAAGGTGPELVVIPKRTSARPGEPFGVNFALSRVETKIGEYNQFCADTGCTQISGPPALPATNLSLEQAQAYAAWLSDQSGKTYRIPTVDEWLYAATTNGTAKVDDNVNCTVDSRGVRLGERLLNTLSGKPNSWGLYNHVGNAREWATKGEELFALGGAHTDPKAECTMSKSVAHSGQADPVTGFRLYREIESTETTPETKSAD